MYHKVCRVVDGKYYSMYAKGVWRLEYRLNEWTYPRVGRIFVVAGYHNALLLAYSNSMQTYAVFECKTRMLGYVYDVGLFNEYWEDYWSKGPRSYKQKYPIAQAICLTRLVTLI